MFTGSLREAQQHEVTLGNEMNLNFLPPIPLLNFNFQGDVHGDALQSLVQYCYTGSIELREDTVETLLATACLLQLTAVVTACCSFLGNSFDDERKFFKLKE